MKDKIVLITGATDGIGTSTARRLAEKGYSIIIHGRSSERLEKTKEKIIEKTGNKNIHTFQADFSSMEDVSQKTKKLAKEFPEIYCLINNAGTFQKEKIITSEGFELTFAINHLAHFLLTHILLENIKRGAPARIINVSSIAHRNTKFDIENLNAEKSFSGYGAYALSKLANILFTNKLAKRLEPYNVTVNSLHPGVIDTKLLRIGFGVGGGGLDEGSENSVYLAVSNKVESITGKYFVKLEISDTLPIANDLSIQLQFWNKSYEMIKPFL